MASNLNLSDAILIQRLDTTASKPELYATSLEKFSEFVALNSDQIIAELSEKVENNTATLVAFQDTLAVVIKDLGAAKLDIYHNRTDIDLITARLDQQEDKVSLFDTRAKVHLFYRWMENVEGDNPANLRPGEMWVQDTGNDTAVVNYSVIDEDGTPVGQPYVYAGETLELTSMYHPTPNRVSKLRHRSVHLITEDPDPHRDYIRVKVKTLHTFSDGDPPYYDEDTAQPAMTRSDFYPMAANLDDYKEFVKDTYVPLSGNKSMHGNLTIEKSSPKIQLQPLDTSKCSINATTTLQLLYGSSLRIDLDADGVKLHTTLDANSNEITNVATPRSAMSAANKDYVETAIASIDFSQVGIDEIFVPGEQVAKIGSASGVEEGGLYVIGSTLYIKMP